MFIDQYDLDDTCSIYRVAPQRNIYWRSNDDRVKEPLNGNVEILRRMNIYVSITFIRRKVTRYHGSNSSMFSCIMTLILVVILLLFTAWPKCFAFAFTLGLRHHHNNNNIIITSSTCFLSIDKQSVATRLTVVCLFVCLFIYRLSVRCSRIMDAHNLIMRNVSFHFRFGSRLKRVLAQKV